MTDQGTYIKSLLLGIRRLHDIAGLMLQRIKLTAVLPVQNSIISMGLEAP